MSDKPGDRIAPRKTAIEMHAAVSPEIVRAPLTNPFPPLAGILKIAYDEPEFNVEAVLAPKITLWL